MRDEACNSATVFDGATFAVLRSQSTLLIRANAHVCDNKDREESRIVGIMFNRTEAT